MSLSKEEAADALVDLYGYFRLNYQTSERMSQAVSMGAAALRNEKNNERTAKWIYDHWCEFKCSNCGVFSISTPRGQEKYCFNCGCKMMGSNDIQKESSNDKE